MKILSPVGNFESLKVAINSGADEVYLGINNFNARNNIDGFNLDSLKDVVDYAHVFGVKVNLAINILFTDNELQDAVDTIVHAYNIGVDSFIIQDLGLAYIIRKNYPEVELHASTQMGLHNLEGVKWAEEFGFKRVVLARETSLEEIKRIKDNTSVEIEYFIQGALCVSFSGNCYLSSKLFNASGNRGRCKQLCRLPFSLVKNGTAIKSGYLLSAKDFMMIDKLEELKNAGVDVLKIEGRARRPYYVGMATREYYKALHGELADKDNLKLGFNRDYTEGYFNGNSGIISRYNNHIGVKIGKVVSVNLGKRFNEVVITSDRELSEKSTFKFFAGVDERCVLTGYDIKRLNSKQYKLTTTAKVCVGDSVHLIIDDKKENEISSLRKKRKIEILLNIQVGEPIGAVVNLNGEEIYVQGSVLDKASNQPLTKEELDLNFSKHDLFYADLKFKQFNKAFLSKRDLNEFRRKVYEVVYSKLASNNKALVKPIKINTSKKDRKFKDFEMVFSINDKRTMSNIIYSPECYKKDDIENVKRTVEEEGRKFYLDLPNFATEEDIKFIRTILNKLECAVVVNNYYGLTFETEKIIGAGLNVHNSISANVLGLPILSMEGDVGGRIEYPYMTLRHCPFKEHMGASCKTCPYEKGFEYVMDNGARMKLKRKKLSSCTFYLVK